jgi:hypothetical protein
LSPDGIVRSLNAAMAAALGRPAEQCVGRYVWELLPESQRTVVGRIAAQASKQRLAMCLSSRGGSWITIDEADLVPVDISGFSPAQASKVQAIVDRLGVLKSLRWSDGWLNRGGRPALDGCLLAVRLGAEQNR